MDTDDITTVLQRAAQTYVTPRFRALSSADVTAKDNPNDLVTVADKEAEQFITAELVAAFPRALVVGEEAAFGDPTLLARLPQAEHAFVIDPIDGTWNFVRGQVEHGVMLAEVRGGVTTRAWIWQPQTGRAYVAVLGEGVTLNGEPLVRPAARRLPVGATSKRHLHGFTGEGALSPVVRTRFACAFDYPRVLHGELDFVNYTKVMPWDHLAGALMITESGGVVGTLDGQPYTVASTYPGLIGACSQEVFDIVLGCWPTRGAAGV